MSVNLHCVGCYFLVDAATVQLVQLKILLEENIRESLEQMKHEFEDKNRGTLEKMKRELEDKIRGSISQMKSGLQDGVKRKLEQIEEIKDVLTALEKDKVNEGQS